MAPVDAEVAQQDNFDRLGPPRLCPNRLTETRGQKKVETLGKPRQRPEDQPAPDQVLAQKEAKVGEPRGSKELLPPLGREGPLQRAEHDYEKQEAQSGCDEQARQGQQET